MFCPYVLTQACVCLPCHACTQCHRTDYLGEARGWPQNTKCRGTVADVAGFPKETAYWLRSVWLSNISTADPGRPVHNLPTNLDPLPAASTSVATATTTSATAAATASTTAATAAIATAAAAAADAAASSTTTFIVETWAPLPSDSKATNRTIHVYSNAHKVSFGSGQARARTRYGAGKGAHKVGGRQGYAQGRGQARARTR